MHLAQPVGWEVSFLLAHEVRFCADEQDEDGLSTISQQSERPLGRRLQSVRLKDSDRDGFSDEAEMNVFLTNPAKPDTDGVSASSGGEILVHRTDPGMWIEPPFISAQPASQTVLAETTATFSVGASGTPMLAYLTMFVMAAVVYVDALGMVHLLSARLNPARLEGKDLMAGSQTKIL